MADKATTDAISEIKDSISLQDPLTIISRARINEVLYKSLQTSTVEQNRDKLIGLMKTKGQLKQQKLEGLMAVLDSLSVPSAYERKFTTTGRCKGYLDFGLAFDLYADLVYTNERQYVTLQQQREQFREDLLHPEHGLCVYIFRCQGTELILLQNDQVELSGVLSVIAEKVMFKETINEEASLSWEFVQGILGTLDSEWSRLVVRGLLSKMMSERQLHDVGIKPTTGNASLNKIKTVIEESKNAKLAAQDIVELRIKESLHHLSENSKMLQDSLSNVMLSEANRRKIEAQLSAIDERIQRKVTLQSNKDSVAFKAMVSRVAQSLVEENRIKDRQVGAGRPSIIDEDTLQMVVQTLESECSAERRRRDSVMYCDRSRIKESDLLNIANFYLEQKGKPCLKSSRTVALWQKPRKSNTREAQRHQKSSEGKYLFTCKKPEKTLEDAHVDTHHQRAHIKLVRMDAYNEDSPVKSLTLDISMDDKATVKAGTDVGWLGTKGRGVFMSTQEPQQYRGHDFVGVESQLTPSAFRVMKWKVADVSEKPSLVRTYDQSFVTVRPKDKTMLGSSGAVWASEQIRLFEEYPAVYCLPTTLPPQTSTFFLRVQHQCHLYFFCTCEDDEADLQALILFEEDRKAHLLDSLEASLKEFKEMDDGNAEISQCNQNEMISILQSLEHLIEKLRLCSIPQDVGDISKHCQSLFDEIKRFPDRPRPYPNILELTDKGPGAGVHNAEVNDLFVLVCLLLESDHRIRLHRAPHDSAQNEAERTNAAIGEALTSGKPVEPPKDPFHGLTTEEIDNMTLKEIDQHCVQWKARNTWAMAGEIASRIDDEPGPGKHDFLVSVTSYPQEKQILLFLAKYLIKWNKSSLQIKRSLPGNALFEKLKKLKEDHVRQGQYFLEYLKFSCTPTCDGCINEGWTRGLPVKRSPVPTLDAASPEKYFPSTTTTSTGVEIDKFLPSVQIKKLFNEGKFPTSEERSLQDVCSQYNVDEMACKSYVQHLEFLDAKAKKRIKERNTLPQISWTSEADVKALTNKQLKMYLKQKGLKISGSKADLIHRVLTHARGNICARDAVEDEESPNSCEDDTNSESSDSDDSSNDSPTYIEESFEVMFVPDEDIQQVN